MTDREEPPSPADLESLDIPIEVNLSPAVRQSIDVSWIDQNLQNAVARIASGTGRSVDHLDVLIVEDRKMSDLHRKHQGLDGPTDVLTFDLSDGDAWSPIEAEIVVCADEAARRSAEFGHSIERELLLYCIHGVLHCAGFDDHDEDNYATMHAEEDRILNEIGVGSIFSVRPRAAGGNGR